MMEELVQLGCRWAVDSAWWAVCSLRQRTGTMRILGSEMLEGEESSVTHPKRRSWAFLVAV